MAKAPADTIKYNIYANISIDGVVEKPDVVGAIFGQAEGLLGEDLELRDLQKTGRIGRIEVDIKTKSGKSSGGVVVPSSLDMVETSIIASAIETVDRVGPCNAKITVTGVEDARSSKRKHVIERAKDILKKLMSDEIPESDTLTDEVRKSVQLSEITSYKGLPAGPSIESADSIIVVEGRADVLNLLRNGIKNAIAVGGTNIPQPIIELSKSKTVIVFVDGDRGGEIILKEMLQRAEVDFVSKAPQGKEVEELSKKEVIMCLRRKMLVDQVKDVKPEKVENGNNTHDILLEELKTVKSKLVAKLFDKNMKQITEMEIKDLVDSLSDIKPTYVVLDGIITQRLVDAANKSSVRCLVGVSESGIKNKGSVKVLTEKRAESSGGGIINNLLGKR